MAKADNIASTEKQRAYWKKYYQDNKGRIQSRTKEYHRAYYQNNKEKFRSNGKAWNLKSKYGLTPDDWTALFLQQGEKCAACGEATSGHKAGWHTDHNHKTGKLRAILCARCNMALGAALECPARLRRLADYVELHDEAGKPKEARQQTAAAA